MTRVEPREVDVLLLVAADVERNAVLDALRGSGEDVVTRTTAEGPYYLGKLGTARVALLQCAQGTTASSGSAMSTVWGILRWSPRAVIMPGIAWARDPRKHLPGDILVADKVALYEHQRVGQTLKGETEIRYRGPVVETSTTLRDHFMAETSWTFELTGWCSQAHVPMSRKKRAKARKPRKRRLAKRHRGEFLCGEKLLANEKLKKDLLQQYPEAIGGEMEAAGVYAAACVTGLPWIVVKGVCDWGDAQKDDLYQQAAAQSCVSLVEHVLKHQDFLDSLPARRRPQFVPAESSTLSFSHSQPEVYSELRKMIAKARTIRSLVWGRQPRRRAVEVLAMRRAFLKDLDDFTAATEKTHYQLFGYDPHTGDAKGRHAEITNVAETLRRTQKSDDLKVIRGLPATHPLIDIHIFDEREVTLTIPTDDLSGTARFQSVILRDPTVSRFFQDYFRMLWDSPYARVARISAQDELTVGDAPLAPPQSGDQA